MNLHASESSFETLRKIRNARRVNHTLSHSRWRARIHSHFQWIQILNIQSRKTSRRYQNTLEALRHLRGYRIFSFLPGTRNSLHPHETPSPRVRNRSQPLRNKTFPNTKSQKTGTPRISFFQSGCPFRNLYGWRYCRLFQFSSRYSSSSKLPGSSQTISSMR